MPPRYSIDKLEISLSPDTLAAVRELTNQPTIARMENELNVIKGLLTEAFGELSAKVAQAQQAAQAPETPGSVKVLLAEVGDLARKLADIIPNPPPAENAAPVAEPAPPAAEAPPAPPATE